MKQYHQTGKKYIGLSCQAIKYSKRMALEGRETLHYGKGTLKVELKAKEENLMGQETKHEHRVPLASTISDY